VPQLFSRHHKLADHVSLCSKTPFNMAVATPDRLCKLIEADALLISSTTHLLLDVSHRDAKKQTLLDIPDTRVALFKALLANPKVMERLREGRLKLVLV
jgi:protein CMS1